MPAESFRYDLLDRFDNVVQRLDGVLPGGTLDFSVSADIRGSGSVQAFGLNGIDWLLHRIRVTYTADELVVPVITALVSVPTEQHSSPGVATQIDLYDKTSILLEDNFGATYAVAAGTNIIDKVVEVIASTNELKVAIEPSTATLTNSMVWEPNTPKLRIVNDLLDAANYFSVWADGLGFFRSVPYTAPAYRAVRYNFVDDETGLYLPAFTRSYDPYSVPNRFIVVGKTDGETEALSKTATVDDGRPWRTRTETDVEYADEATLQAIAERKLATARQVGETFDITHPYLGFGLNDAVTFTNQRVEQRLAVCQKQTWTLQAGGLILSTLRTVTT